MKFKTVAGLLMAACAALPAPAFAWGYEGHKVVAAIARTYLSEDVRAKVDALLAADTDSLEPHDMLSAATWADSYRKAHRETAQWHFVDLELDNPDGTAACFGYPASAKPASAGPAQDCITDRIKAFQAELADPATSQAERILALKFVLHLVGDVHQPLHASDNHDHGGNCVAVALGPKISNLHSYWDTGVIVEMGTDPVALAAKLRAQITPAQKSAWEAGDAETWAAESFKIAKSTAYNIPTRPGCDSLDRTPLTPPSSYDDAAKAAAGIQLERAGVRLAWVLNRALANPR